MGQYHKTVSLTKREFINPHSLGCGLKLVEQIDTKAGVPTALMVLLACSNDRGGGDLDTFHGTPLAEIAQEVIGRWAGDRVAVVGDYAKRPDLDPGDDADLIYLLCVSDPERLDTVAHYRELAGREKDKA